MSERLTPKQARTALAALDNALARLDLFCDMDGITHPLYRRREDGVTEAPTQWETEALFRLRSALVLRQDDDK